jgi:hypothetical protein
MGMEEKILPYTFDLRRIATDQARTKMIPQQSDHGRTASPDRVAVADPLRAITAGDAHDRRFLLDE